jgi:hypothetical protein
VATVFVDGPIPLAKIEAVAAGERYDDSEAEDDERGSQDDERREHIAMYAKWGPRKEPSEFMIAIMNSAMAADAAQVL